MAQRQLLKLTRRPQQQGDCLASSTPVWVQAKQIETLRTLRSALIANGIKSLDKQAAVLCLPRSTAWFVLHGNHKYAGPNAALVMRMLRSKQLPDEARRIVMRYIHERVQGAYGHSTTMRLKFATRLEKLGYSVESRFDAT